MSSHVQITIITVIIRVSIGVLQKGVNLQNLFSMRLAFQTYLFLKLIVSSGWKRKGWTYGRWIFSGELTTENGGRTWSSTSNDIALELNWVSSMSVWDYLPAAFCNYHLSRSLIAVNGSSIYPYQHMQDINKLAFEMCNLWQFEMRDLLVHFPVHVLLTLAFPSVSTMKACEVVIVVWETSTKTSVLRWIRISGHTVCLLGLPTLVSRQSNFESLSTWVNVLLGCAIFPQLRQVNTVL